MPPAWDECLNRLKGRVSADVLNQWVAPLHPVHHDGTLKLLAPNRYVLDYVKKNLFELIEKTILEAGNGVKRIQVEIGGHLSEAPLGGAGASTDSAAVAEGANGANSANSARSPGYLGSKMDPAHTFEGHVEGNSNCLARAAALQVGQNPGRAYNPLFIYGGVGLGKTHLMQAAGHLMLGRDPRAKVVYVRSEQFLGDFKHALGSNTMKSFNRYYRSLGALLIDDIQFLVGKPSTQEELFHTFNTVLEGRRQIIITSDRIPNAINVDDRLVSRFNGGLEVCIEPPELETRAAILEKKAQEQGVTLPGEVAFFVANAIRSNVRALTGALHRVLATARFSGRPLDVDLARDALRDQLAHQQQQLSIDNIQRIVAEYYKLRVADLQSKSRARNVARPRQLAMYFAKEYTSLSLDRIGNRFGGRDHTTVLYACRKVAELTQNNPQIKEDFCNLQRLFGV